MEERREKIRKELEGEEITIIKDNDKERRSECYHILSVVK